MKKSEWLLFNPQKAMFQLYHGESKLHLMMESLNWFRANQSLLLLLNTAYFAVFGLTQQVFESTLSITPPMQFRLMRYIPLLIYGYKTTDNMIIW